jgi:hypothetical protein
MRTPLRSFPAFLQIVVAVFFLWPGKLAAAPWSLVSCDPSGEAQWRAFEREVRAAKPGSTLYVPKPYPTSDQDVVADFLATYRSLHREIRGQRGGALVLG